MFSSITRPREPEIPFGPQVPLFPASAVFSVSAVPFRHRSLAKRNGAHRRTGQGEKAGGGEDRAVAGSVPAAARLFPLFLMKRCTIPRRASVKWNLLPARAHKKNRSRKLYKDGSFTK
ncbi:MAG: hypothetical protein K5882_07800 [Bacteroidales bacterium]|nr:hypothetical protein [Bacteroidales bacterium]